MTITASNYFAEADKFISKLPAAAKEAHELVSSMKKDGIADPFNTGDADIDGMAQSLLDQANKILATSEKKAVAPAKAVKKAEKKKITAKFIREDDNGRGIYKGSDGEMYVDVDGVAHDMTDSGEPLTPMPNVTLIFPKVKKAKKSPLQRKPAKSEGGRGMKKPAPKAKPVKKAKNTVRKSVRKKTVPLKKAKKHTQKVVAKAVKAARKSDAQKAPVTVKKLSLELQTIKSFLGMAGKSYKAKAIIAKHTALGNHLKAGHITDHKTTIETIHRNYSKMVAAIKEHSLLTCKVNITPATQKQYKALIADAKVRVRTEFLSGAGDNRINEMVKHWKKTGWAKSHIDNNDDLFFNKIKKSPMELSTTSFTGNDIIYYDENKVYPKTGSMVKVVAKKA